MKKFKEVVASLEARWFMSSMATGALGILWYKTAHFIEQDWMIKGSIILTLIAFILFISASIGYFFRITYHYHLVKKDFIKSATSKFFAGISISLSVLSATTTVILVPESILGMQTGKWLAGTLYFLGIILGIIFLLSICSTMIKSSENKIEQAIGVCLLPPVGMFVNIFAGNFWIKKFIAGTSLAQTLTIVHFFIFTLLILLTGWIMTFIIFRLRFHPLPQKEMAPSFFIPLAPAGVSIIAIVSLIPLFSEKLPYASILKSFSFMFIPMMIAFGLFWSIMLITIVYNYIKKEGFPYTLGFWALVFPMSAFGVSLFVAGQFLPGLKNLMWIGSFWCLITSLIWIMVLYKTIHAIITGKAFVRPPCLKH